MSSQSETESSPCSECWPHNEQSIVSITTNLLLSEKFEGHICSCSIERLYNMIERKAKGLLSSVFSRNDNLSAYYLDFLSQHEDFTIISTDIDCGRRIEKLIKVSLKGTDYEIGDNLLKHYECKRDAHHEQCLLLALEKVGKMTVDQFITSYKSSTLCLDLLYPLPKRGDLVRFISKRRSFFNVLKPTNNTVIIQLRTQSNRRIMNQQYEPSWNNRYRQPTGKFHNSYYH